VRSEGAEGRGKKVNVNVNVNVRVCECASVCECVCVRVSPPHSLTPQPYKVVTAVEGRRKGGCGKVQRGR
jgi:hypothetical protein